MQPDGHYQLLLTFWLLSTTIATLTFLLFLLLVALDISIDSGDQCLRIDIEPVGALRQVGVAFQIIRNHRNAFQDAADGLRTFQGVSDTLQKQVGLKLNEVRLVFLYIRLELLGGVFSAKRVRVITVWQ